MKKKCKHKRQVTTKGWETWICPKCKQVVEFKQVSHPLEDEARQKP